VSLREPAWRLTTRELELSIEEERGEGERVASYLLSPFGARTNRAVLAGNLSAAEAVGREEPPTFWRARLTDPLGTIGVTAGSFQPRAMAQLRAAPAGRPALVIGKVHLYRGRDDVAVVSVRAEAVRPVPEAEERAAVAEIVRQSLDRLDLLERLEHEPGTTDGALRTAGWPALWIRAAREALRRYPDADRAGFRAALGAGVRRVAGSTVLAVPPPPPAAVTVTVDPPPVASAFVASDADRAEEATFLDLVDEAAEVSADGYADVRELLRRLADRGVRTDRAEAVLGRLEEGGVLEEPVVGKLRRA
jgi:RPA family protein